MPLSKSLLAGALLAALSGISYAAATEYVFTDFTLDAGSTVAPTKGHFTYDPLVGFTSFEVEWRGAVFDLTFAANRPSVYADGNNSIGTHAQSFELLTRQELVPGRRGTWGASADCGDPFECPDSGFSFSAKLDDKTTFSIFTTAPVAAPDLPRTQQGGWSATAVPEADVVVLFGAGLASLGMSGVLGRRKAHPGASLAG